MNTWVSDAVREVESEPQRIVGLFPAAGRAVGREPVHPASDPLGLIHGTSDDLARERLVQALLAAAPPHDSARLLGELYRYGDDAERRGVLRGLNAAPHLAEAVVTAGLELAADALRTNDQRLVAAALGEFSSRHIDQHSWRHGVLKAVFMGIPLAAVYQVEQRSDAELARMAAALIDERRAAHRDISTDIERLAATTTQPGG